MATAEVISEQVRSGVSVEEYLRSSYDPDCDFVDGALEERNFGEWNHARLQAALASIFFQNESAWEIEAVIEARLQINAARFRVPDVMILRKDHETDRIVRTTLLLCIEVLSPDDTWLRMEKKSKTTFGWE